MPWVPTDADKANIEQRFKELQEKLREQEDIIKDLRDRNEERTPLSPSRGHDDLSSNMSNLATAIERLSTTDFSRGASGSSGIGGGRVSIQLRKFAYDDKNDYEEFENCAKNFALFYDLKPPKLIYAILSVFEGRAIEVGQALADEAEWLTDTEDVWRRMRELFVSPLTKEVAKAEFLQRRQKENENTIAYHASLKNIYSRAGLTDKDALISRFLTGLYNPKVHEKVMLKDTPADYTKALDMVLVIESRLAMIEWEQKQREGIDAQERKIINTDEETDEVVQDEDSSYGRGFSQGRREIICYRCQGPGHVAKFCRANLEASQTQGHNDQAMTITIGGGEPRAIQYDEQQNTEPRTEQSKVQE